MGLVSGITTTVNPPDELDQWVEIRKLSSKQLRESRRRQQLRAAETARAFGGDIMAALQNANTSEVATAAADPRTNHDQDYVLEAGVVNWSYETPAKKHLDDLDEPTAEWLVGEILTFAGVMQTADEAEAARKNA
jgi:hypothetical protein